MWLALAFAGGSALALAGLPSPPALLLPLTLLLPVLLLRRPVAPAALAVAALAGLLYSSAWARGASRDCRLRLPDGASVSVTGRLGARPGSGMVPLHPSGPLPGGCRGPVRVLLPPRGPRVAAGAGVRVEGTWRASPAPPRLRPDLAGHLAVRSVEVLQPRGTTLLGVRGGVQERVAAVFGPHGPLVEALVLARKEGLDPRVREAFALSGTAHLLAISGFHVGVVAGLLVVLARGLGAGRRAAPVVAAAGVWAYVLSIGAPDAACRAALILTLAALARLRARPAAPTGALATSLLALVLVDPGALARPGFQLSFAGTAGLVLWAGPLERRMARWSRFSPPRSLRSAVAAGTAATVATAPLVAWHFDRVAIVGLPATLVAGPLVAAAIPGIFATLALSSVHDGLGGFLAGGTALLLEATLRCVEAAAGLPGAAPWVPRTWLLAAAAGGAGAWCLRRPRPDVRPSLRRAVVAAGAVAGVLLLPALERVGGAGTMELVFLDVGQGDAVALRSPRGRWILVDAGPRSDRFDAGERRVVPLLRRRGASRIEALVLTHPHLDHIGGGPAVLAGLRVAGVLDPARPAAEGPYLRVLEQARARGVGWWAAEDGHVLDLDGVELRVLHPPVRRPEEQVHDVNATSVILLVRFGAFSALLTGDAGVAEEERVLSELPGARLSLLKAGHHGSRTSTSWELLERMVPEAAVISAGRRNRYGHPHAEVVERLERSGARIFRTDRDGTVVVRARRDGRWHARLPERRGAAREDS